jgi:hypothetical protein
MQAHRSHETHEKVHHAHGHPSGQKWIAVMISVLAALLALTELGAKSAQNNALALNIELNDIWGFYQAKAIRGTILRTAATSLDMSAPPSLGAEQKAQWQNQTAEWKALADKYDSDPESGEGRKELQAKAKQAEAHRDHALGAYHLFEYGAAILEIAIVLVSAAMVTEILPLAYLAGGFGLIGLVLGLLGWLAPGIAHAI